MACSATPTTTLYSPSASTSTTISFSPSVTTLPPVVTTFTTETCSPTGASPHDTGCVTVEVAVVSTVFAGGPSTNQVPVQIVYEYTNFVPTATLFATCPTQRTALDGPSPPSSNTSSSTDQQPSSTSSPDSATSTAYVTTVITPAPSVIVTSQTITESNGSTVYILTTYTSTFSPVSALLPNPSGGANGSHHSSSAAAIAPVVGGILGGFFGLIGLVVLIWWLWRRIKYGRARPHTPDVPSMAYAGGPGAAQLDEGLEPKPYHYGGLGSHTSRGSSRPNSPRARSSTYSQGNPPTTPGSGNRSSTRLSITQSGAPTPTFFPSTAIAPGQSQPNSRPSTPGYFPGHGGSASAPSSPPPSAYMRQSWPRYASDGEDSGSDSAAAPIMYPRRERRPSRLSLTLSMMDGTRESGDGGERRSTTASVKSGPSVSTEAHQAPEQSRSTLFVVNNEAAAALAVPASKPAQSASGHSDDARSMYARAG
ncbi:hypothetical protein PsYK624_137850 [Phanerochaete sordida]|uniref:Mid2 domain-containing protein n=1 Tax=Phanerochaete sordida TaxID=48140 RepID=A0A9P3GQE8_9APHY|nr:hypothetical protein PsYK624_137850 [Phanerochaete sordida]